ncbi:MAG: DUF2232 domain-containing protein [Deltaproteobacteria bacterium]|nr:DUF2232 domain-containing protein [Deltaproteobacteria bacterium]
MKDRGGGIFNRDFISGIVISSFVFLVAGTLSIFGSIGAMLAPLPILYYYSKLGRARGILIFVLSLLVVIIVLKYVNSHATFLNLFLLGSLGIILSEVLRRNYSVETTVFFAVMIFLGLGLMILLYLSIMQGKGPLHLVQSYIAGVVQENIRIYSQLGGSSDQIELLKKHADHITRFFTNLFPAIVLVGTAFFVWLNILAGRILFQKNGMWYPDFGDLSRWKIHDKFVWLLIISGIFVLLPLGALKIVGINVLVLLLFLYLFQGLSIIQFYCNKKGIPLFIRIIGYFLIFAQQFLLLLVIGLGVIDVWADFRKLEKAD